MIWLQGIWLPLRGFSFAQAPLWSAIYMLPLTIGFLVAGPLAGIWSDRLGPRPFTIGGLLAATAPFVDRAIPAAVASELAVPVASAEARDEQREPGALRLLVSAANTEPLFGLEVADADFDDEDRFRLATEAALWKLAATTGGVILGRAGAVVLAGHPRAIHVRIVASRETRCRRVHEYGGLAEPEALRLIDRTDHASAAYAHPLYG